MKENEIDWPAANQRYLMAAVAVVDAHLIRHAGENPDLAAAQTALDAEKKNLPGFSPLDMLCAALGLSPFERDVLLLCAGRELEGSFAARCPRATFALALAALPNAHWSALSPAAPLRRWHLIEIGHGETIADSPLRIDERVLHHLTGTGYLDDRLAGLVLPARPRTLDHLPPSQRALAEQIAACLRGSPDTLPPIVHLGGDDREAKEGVAAAACAALGLRLYVLPVGALPANRAELGLLIRLWEREAALTAGALLIDGEAPGDPVQEPLIDQMLARTGGALFVAGCDHLYQNRRACVRFDVHKPGAAEQSALWRGALGAAAIHLNGQVDALASQFCVGTETIRAASAQAAGSEDPGSTLWEFCRRQARPRLDELAQRIEPSGGWDDLVLPEPQRQILREITAQVRQRAVVYERWGFGARSARGLGISALFSGASGTGKTLAAEVLAGELRLDLFRIDLASVVSKYIGETEKNLRRVFDAAEGCGAILLFDEADALFGKRSEVKDSHDRYANIEVSYLLQRMEAYRGLAILTTNLKNALDPAFLRRIRFVIPFPFPDEAQRREIWRRVFPAATPTEALNWEKLARLSVAGGNIRNIALNAAFLAAGAGEPVRMGHLLQAARGECAKIEKPLTDAEIGGWA